MNIEPTLETGWAFCLAGKQAISDDSCFKEDTMEENFPWKVTVEGGDEVIVASREEFDALKNVTNIVHGVEATENKAPAAPKKRR